MKEGKKTGEGERADEGWKHPVSGKEKKIKKEEKKRGRRPMMRGKTGNERLLI